MTQLKNTMCKHHVDHILICGISSHLFETAENLLDYRLAELRKQTMGTHTHETREVKPITLNNETTIEQHIRAVLKE